MSKGTAKPSLWTVPAKLSPFYKWFIVIFLVIGSAISFPWIFDQFGDLSRIFIFIFVIPVVFFWGLKGGLIIAVLSTLTMMAFYQVSGEKFTGGIIGPLFLFLMVIILGRMRDLSLQLEAELQRRDQAEIELAEHQVHLEKMIKERTLELSTANTELEQEISERRIAAAALQESEEKYRGVVKNANEAIIVAQDGILKFANQKAIEISGYSGDELKSKPFLEFVFPDDQQMVVQHHLNRMSGKENPEIYELRFVAKNGDVKLLENNGVIISWDGKPATLNLLTDITDRNQAEQALANAKNQWEETFEAVWDWVSIIDQDHKIIRSNTAYKNFIDLPPDQVMGKNCYDIVHGLACPISECPMERAVKSRQRENMEFQLESGQWVMVSVDPIKGENSQGLFVHIVRNITDIKKREKEILNARKAESFSILSGGIAHDYNNLLSIIWGNISLLRAEITDPLQQEFFEEAEKACEQARLLTHQFITLSEGAMIKKRLLPIEGLIKSSIEKTNPKKEVKILYHIQDTIPEIEADPDYLKIVFQNIIQNSMDAISGEGQVNITAETEWFVLPDQNKGKRLKISFEDNGTGIGETDLMNVFDPYFTTKQMVSQKGSGLGLSVSKAIIKKHGGDIRVTSMAGKGTKVDVYLPLPDKDPNVQIGSNDVTASKKPTIICVDDDASVIKICVRMLEGLNCRVIMANNTDEAIENYLTAVKNNITIDLILLDQNIQGRLGGIETLKAFRKYGYAGKALVVTGSPSSPVIFDFTKFGFDGKLLKPYTKKELRDAVNPYVSI